MTTGCKYFAKLCFRTLTPENIILPRLKPEKHKLFTEIDGKKNSNDKISREEFRQWIVDVK